MEGSELSDSLRNYFHTDEEKPYGISYYKWMQIDYDGRTRYSNIVPLLKSDIGAELEVVLYPVPLPKGDLLKLHYKSPDREPVSMSISDIYGRILLQKNQNKEMDVLEVEFSTEKLSAGSYFLIIDHPVRPIVRRFFVY